MQLTTHAEDLLKKSYYRKDKDGNVAEDWDKLCRRVANHIAKGDYCTEHSRRNIINFPSLAIDYTEHLYHRKNEDDKNCCGTCIKYRGCSKVKEIEDKFYDLLYNQYLIVNTPSLMNSGTDLGGLSACFIIAIEDSMESILNAVKQMGMILKTGGGVGFSFGKVRQKGAKIGSTGGVSSGVISWLKIFNQVVEEVKQGGRRRGAGSCVLPVYHPDILEYLTCKTDNSVITNFNLSVGITDDFVKKTMNGEDYDLIEPHTGKVVGRLNAKEVFEIICKQAVVNGEPGLFFLDTVNKYNPVPKSGDILSGNPCVLPTTKFLTEDGETIFSDLRIGGSVWTGKQWSPLVKIWSTGIKPVYRYTTEHGYFIDCTPNHQIVQRGSKIEIKDATEIDIATIPQEDRRPAYLFNRIISSEYLGDLEVFDFTVEAEEHTVWANGLLISNCFEFVLPPYNSCTLGAINLSKIITNIDKSNKINYLTFDSIISTAVRMLDNTITMNKFPIPEIEETTLANRPIGLGFLNLSELFIKLGLVYGSDESLDIARAVTSYMRKKAIEASVELAKERGSYPNFDLEDWTRVNCKYIDNFEEDFVGARNSTVLSIAPNGSTGVIVNASSGGVEPIFAVSYERKTVDCGDMHMVNPLFEEMMPCPSNRGGLEWDTILKDIEDNAGSVKDVFGVPTHTQKLFVTAREIPYEQHIKMQAAVQTHVDLSISKTVNLLSDATVDDVKNAYIMAHGLGCKGVTIYREGSRENEVLSTKKKEVKLSDLVANAGQEGLFNHTGQEATFTNKLPVTSDDLLQHVPETTEEDTYPEDDDFIPEVRERRDPVIGYTYKIGIHNLKIYITVNFNSDELTPIECFMAAGKPGDDINAITQSISRLVSLGLKFKIPIDEIINQLDSLAGEDIVWMGGGKILSVPDAVAKVLKWATERRSVDFVSKDPKQTTVKGPCKQYTTNTTFTMSGKNNCPNCGDTLVFQEGCRKCLSCDYNKCG